MSLKQRDYCFAVVRRGFGRACKVSLTTFPNHMNQEYIDYLNSPAWASRRDNCLRRARNRCEGCGYDRRINVHHLTYAHIYEELPEELMALCMTCHDKAERAKESGRLPKRGNPYLLRDATMDILRVNHAPAVTRPVAPKCSKFSRNGTQEWLMGQDWFIAILNVRNRHAMKKSIRARFGKRNNKIKANAIALFDRKWK